MALKRRSTSARLCALAAVLLSGIGLAACGGSSSNTTTSAAATGSSLTRTSTTGGSTTPFKALLLIPESGKFSVPGQAELNGFKAAVNVVNAQGGILGHKVELTILDDQDVGTTAVSLAQQQLTNGATYNLIIPGINGADAIPLAGVFAHTNTLQITSAAEAQLDQPSKYPNLFMSLNNFPANEQAIAARLKQKGITRVAYLSGDDPSGQGAGQAFAAAAKAAGLTLTATVLVPDTAVDAKPQYQQALASNPQAIVVGAFTPAAATILAARVALGNTTPLYGDAFFASFPLELVLKQPAQMKNIVLENFPYLTKGSTAQKTAWYQTFSAAYLKLVPKPVLNLNAGAVPYNVLMLARAAAVKANSIDGAAMAKAIPQIATASQVPDFVGDPRTGIFSATEHQLQVKPSNFAFYPAGPTIDGLLVPAS